MDTSWKTPVITFDSLHSHNQDLNQLGLVLVLLDLQALEPVSNNYLLNCIQSLLSSLNLRGQQVARVSEICEIQHHDDDSRCFD